MAEKKKKTCGHCKSGRTKVRSDEEKKKLTGRLNRAIGQLNGLKKMVEEDAYCADILIQASACTAAVNSFSKVLISSHLKSCVQNDIKNGNEESLDEFLKIMSKLLK
ncbi:MAG: metal-sensing transcriptional repressor [Treponema sp.]|nr:metal-sensing transcriptional repressor [Treponema sp.]